MGEPVDLFEKWTIKPGSKIPTGERTDVKRPEPTQQDVKDAFQKFGLMPADGSEQKFIPVDENMQPISPQRRAELDQTKRPPGDLGADPEDLKGQGEIGKGLFYGTQNFAFGLDQAVLDGLGRLGVPAQQFREELTRKQMEMRRGAGLEPKEREKEGTASSVMKVADRFGEVASALVFPVPEVGMAKSVGAAGAFVWRLANQTVRAGVLGAIEPQKPGEDESRFDAAMRTAKFGALGEVASEIPRYAGTKLINAVLMRHYVKEVESLAQNFDQNNRLITAGFNGEYTRRSAARTLAYQRETSVGNRVLSDLDTNSLVPELNKILNAAKDRRGKNESELVNQLENAVEKLTIRTPPNTNIGGFGSRPANKVNYQDLTEVERDLSAFITRAKGSQNTATTVAVPQAVEAKKLISNFLENEVVKARNPSLNEARELSKRYHTEDFDFLRTRDFADMRNVGPQMGSKKTAYQGTKKILDLATGEDAEMAERVFKATPAKSMNEMKKGIVFRALDSSLSVNGYPDAAAFIKFMEREGPKKFFNSPEDQNLLKGMEATISANALRVGKLRETQLPVRGETQAAMAAGEASMGGARADEARRGMAGLSAMVLTNTLGRAMNSQGGQALLNAAGRAKENSPEFLKIYNTLIVRFGGLQGNERENPLIGVVRDAAKEGMTKNIYNSLFGGGGE